MSENVLDLRREARSVAEDLFSAGLVSEEDVAAARMSGPRRWWCGKLDVEGLALASTALILGALGRLPSAAARVSARSERVAAGFDSYRHLRLTPSGGSAPLNAGTGFTALSRFWRTEDGWVRTHGAYPHHRRALAQGLRALGAAAFDGELQSASGVDWVARVLAGANTASVESAFALAGAPVAGVRTREDWLASGLSREQPLSWTPWPGTDGRRAEAGGAANAGGGASRGARNAGWRPPSGAGAPPLAGLKVVELTRVIAGPTATRTLAALGAQVLRVDPPELPELLLQHLDTDHGKTVRSRDLRAQAEREWLHQQLQRSHVLVTGYRPGSLDRFGLSSEDVRARHPHLVMATVDAWGSGAWAERTGFDSLVQAACGIARDYADADSPGALPVQALDHASGQALAAGVIAALASPHPPGLLKVSLAGTAGALYRLGEASGGGGGSEDKRKNGCGLGALAPVQTLRRNTDHGVVDYVPVSIDVEGGAMNTG